MFLKARLKLTGLYVLIIAVIICGFSLFLYQTISRNLRDSADEDFSGIDSHHHFIQNTLGSVESDIVTADVFILIIAALLSYYLAGKTLEPIQNSVEAQKKFAAHASHELRTPLAVMKNEIEVLLRNGSPRREMVDATLHSNLEEIQTMSGMIENLLLLARSDNHVLPPMVALDLIRLIVDVVAKIKPLTDEKGIGVTLHTIESNSDPAQPLMIYGNAENFRRAIINILENSIRYTPHGGRIDITVEKIKKHAVLKIADTGSGITSTDLPYVFDRFYKGQSTGTGLGLSIVKEVVHQHKGTVGIESVFGKSTTVTCTVPLV